jgi:iron complex transport system substrate-binding protein
MSINPYVHLPDGRPKRGFWRLEPIRITARRRVVVWAAWMLASALAGASACGCKDKTVPLPSAASPRLVTYSPALTKLVLDMGLGDHIVGVTNLCDVPPGLRPRRVGDIMRPPSVEAILSVKPDAILIQQDAGGFEPVRLVAPNIRVEHFTIETIADIPPAVERIGQICGRPDDAKAALAKWRSDLDAAEAVAAGRAMPATGAAAMRAATAVAASVPAGESAAEMNRTKRPRVLFVMGYQNPSTGGAGTFISDMIERAGGVNAAAELRMWSPIGLEYALSVRPDVLVCLLDSPAQNESDARAFWQPALRAGARWVVLSDRNWEIPGLHTAGCVLKLANILHGAEGDRP